MLICHLHESGLPRRSASERSHYVLFGVAVPAGTAVQKHEQAVAIMQRFGVSTWIHAPALMRRYPEQDCVLAASAFSPATLRAAVLGERRIELAQVSLRRGDAARQLRAWHAQSDSYIHLTPTERLGLLTELTELLCSWQDAVLFFEAHATGVHTPLNASPLRVLDYTYEQVARRFRSHLYRRKLPRGMMVHYSADRARRSEALITARSRKLKRHWQPGAPDAWGLRTVDRPELTLVQLAGIGAYAIRRLLEGGNDDLYDRLSARIDRAKGDLAGGRHYTGPRPCTCRICRDRQRAPASAHELACA